MKSAKMTTLDKIKPGGRFWWCRDNQHQFNRFVKLSKDDEWQDMTATVDLTNGERFDYPSGMTVLEIIDEWWEKT